MADWICNRCNGAIVGGEWRRSNERMYHVECFTCAICDTPIDATTREIKTNLQEVYCRDCHEKYFQDVSRHSIFGGVPDAENSREEIQQAIIGDGAEVGSSVKVENITETNSHESASGELNAGPDGKENVNSQAIMSMLHKYSTPVHSIHEIMPPPTLPLVKRTLRSRHQPRPETPKLLCTPTIIEDANESSFEPKLNDSELTPLTSTLKKKTRPRSRIPVLTPVSSRTQVDGNSSAPAVKSECTTAGNTVPSSTPRRNKSDLSRISTPVVPIITPKRSAAVNDYLKNKMRRGQDGSRTPSRKGTPMKATHSLPKTCQMSRPKTDFPKSCSCLPTDVTFTRPSTAGNYNLASRNSDPQAAASTTFIVQRNSPKKMRQSSSKSESRTGYAASSHSSITSHGHLQLMSWNNVHVSPAQLPSTQQLLSLMGHPEDNSRPESESMSWVSSALSSRNIRSRTGFLDCPICYDGLVDDSVKPKKRSQENVVTTCGHIFHRECITNWLESNGNDKCPICQKLCAQDSLIAVYLDANASDDSKSADNGLSSLVNTLRHDYQELVDKYNCLLKEHQDCGVKCAISDSLRKAYEVECRNRVELQWENKRLQRKIEELQGRIREVQKDAPNKT